MKRRYLLGLLVLLLALAAVAAACGGEKATTTSAAPATTAGPATTAAPSSDTTAATTAEPMTLKIGLITSVSGPMAPAFKPQYDAVGPIEELINSKGGVTVEGQQYLIDILAEDDQSSPAGAVAAVNKLIGEGVKFLIPPMFMPNNLAIAQICEDNKVLRFKSFGAGPAECNPDVPYSIFVNSGVYNITPFYDTVAARYPNVKKIAIITPDDPGSAKYVELVKAAIASHGMEEVYFEAFPIPTEDFYPILNKALATKPDAIEVIMGIPPWSAGIINQSRELGFTGPIFGPCTLGEINVINSMLTPGYGYDVVTAAPDVLSDKMMPLVQELRPLVEATGSPFLMDSALPLDAVYVMLQCIDKAQSLDTEKVLAAIDNDMPSFDTIWGPGAWSGMDIFGINHVGVKPLLLSTIQDGKVVFEFVK
jgi:branched-chain amino acid transport system substrate-binding protein